MSISQKTRIRRIGKYPMENFAYLFSDGHTRIFWPVQMYFSGDSVWSRGVECERGLSPYASIELVREGRFRLVLDSESVDVLPGTLLLLPPETHTRLICESEIGKKYVFAFSGSMLPEIFENLGLVGTFHATLPHPDVWERFADEAELKLRNRNGTPEDCAVFAYRLLLEFRSVNELKGYPLPLRRILLYISHCLPHAPQIADLVRESAVSQAEIYRLFRKYLRISPADYIRDLRLKRAAELLRISECSVKEISDRLCFSSPQYFAGEFRICYGASPREYRKKYESSTKDFRK